MYHPTIQGPVNFKGNNLTGYYDIPIINITCASNCPSKKLGLCKNPPGVKCLAQLDEDNKDYGDKVFDAKLTQEKAWETMTEDEIVKIFKNKKKPIAVRVNASGDFRNQDDVNKMKNISEKLTVPFYGWTSRNDLNFSKSKYFKIRGSGGKDLGNGLGSSIILDNIKNPEGYLVCPSGGKKDPTKKQCNKCKLCFTEDYLNISFKIVKEKL